MATNTGAAILERLIMPENDDLSADAARSLLQLEFRPDDHARMEQLSTKAQQGTLTASERNELDNYLRVADQLAILQSKARRLHGGTDDAS